MKQSHVAPSRLQSYLWRRSTQFGLGLFLVVGPVCLSAWGQAPSPTPLKKILFFDDEDVSYRSGTRRVLNPWVKSGTAAVLKPSGWDANGLLTLCSVVYREDNTPKYQMWYQVDSTAKGFTGANKQYDNVVAYAESTDGLLWTKPYIPSSAIFTYPLPAPLGTTGTNIVLTGIGSTTGHRAACSVIYDSSAAVDQRYRMVYTDWASSSDPSQGAGLRVAYSSDGMSWNKYGLVVKPMGFNQRNLQPPTGSNTYIATGTNWAVPLSISDALNVFHDPDTGQDVIYGKLSIDGPTGAMDWKRGMGRLATTGSGAVNFQSWSDPEIILTPDDKDDRLDDGIPANDFDIGFQDSPVLKYNGMYLSLNQLLDANAGTSDIEFMSSRDGRHWKRLRKADYNNVDVLPRGLIVSGSYLSFDSRYIYTNASLVRNPGSSDTTITDDTLRIYYGGYGAKTGIGEAELPLDQIVGLKSDWIWGVSEVNDTNPNITVGMITLKPMSLAGVSTMYLNATTYTTTTGSVAGYAGTYSGTTGSIQVEVLNSDGYVVDAFEKSKSLVISGSISAEAKWGTLKLSNLSAGSELYMIRIYLVNATLYGCSFY